MTSKNRTLKKRNKEINGMFYFLFNPKCLLVSIFSPDNNANKCFETLAFEVN